MTCCFFVIHIKRKNRFSKITFLTISAVNFNRKEPLDFQTVRGQLEHTLITPVRWLHYSTEGESPGLRSPLLHILSWAITSSQGGLNTALSMSATITQTENIWQAINTAENTCFCPLFDPFIHVPYSIWSRRGIVFLLPHNMETIYKKHRRFGNSIWKICTYGRMENQSCLVILPLANIYSTHRSCCVCFIPPTILVWEPKADSTDSSCRIKAGFTWSGNRSATSRQSVANNGKAETLWLGGPTITAKWQL